MGDGTEENPYTREDVERKIKEHGGTAKGLDLSGMVFEDGIDLSGLDLKGIILNKARFLLNLRRDSPLRGANLKGVHLEGAHLRSTHLEEADLSDAYLESANLGSAHLEGANLSGTHLGNAYLGYAHLQGAILLSTEFSADTGLENVDWGKSYILGEEKQLAPDMAEDTYRRLKQWYTNAGIYDIAGEFFFREMTAQRKRIEWWPHPAQRKSIRWWLHPQHRAWSKFVSLICGYGERPHRVVASGVVVVFGLAAVYYLFGGLTLPYSLYYSAVSFTALGYGKWVDIIPQSWVQAFGAAESFLGVFMIALFLITFTRKMRR